ncbi:hypothetical protein COT47_06485 [Candidatus Woesearchaeota archaeon CG08_land_8_20_14_0_20_43_7]|nr:MAG: hypothetical protein COT47_06485 [Candidatus Woesearchaeota archaeon CG08_land_8_20_14_0_20_43_7]
MMYLILVFPIYSAAAFGKLYSGKIYGEDKVAGFVKQNDYTYAEAQASFISNGSDPALVKLGSMPFTKCMASTTGNYDDCTLIPPYKSPWLSEGMHTYTITQLDGDYKKIDSLPVVFYVDVRKPEIKTMAFLKTAFGDEPVSFSLTAEDPATCSAIKEIQIYKKGSINIIKNITPSSMTCSYTEVVTIASSTISPSTGTVDLCAKAIDLLGQESAEKCTAITIDLAAPSVNALSLNVTDQNGMAADYFYKPFYADVRVDVVDAGSGLGDVYADFSQFLNSGSSAKKKGSCTLTSSSSSSSKTYECLWTNIYVSLSASKSVTLSFNATDLAKNSVVANVVHSMSYDNAGPVVSAIRSDHSGSDGKYYLGLGPDNITVSVTDAGVGFDMTTMFLDLGSVTGDSKMSPVSCTSSGCVWSGIYINSISKDEKKYKIGLSSDSSDLLGNHATGLTQEFTVDLSSPVIDAVGLFGNKDGLFVSGDYMQAIVNITELNEISSAVANFSGIISGLDDSTGTCTQIDADSGEWQCAWSDSIGPLDKGKKSGYIRFDITDQAGNTVKSKHKVTIYRTEDNDTISDHFDSSIGAPSPDAVNRHLMDYMNTFITFPVTLNSDDAVPLRVTLEGCTGEGMQILNNAAPYTNKPRLIQFPSDLTQLYVEFSFDVQSYPYDNLSIDCNLGIVSLVDGKTVSNKELEPLNFTIPFYNQPFGTLDSQVGRKINETVDGFLIDSLAWIDYVEKVIMIAEKLCGIYNVLQNIMLVWGKVTSLWGSCCGGGLTASAACCPQQQSSAVQLEGTKEGLKGTYTTVKKWCALIGCTAFSPQWTKDTGYADKYFDWAKDNNLPISQYKTNVGYLGNVEPKDSLVLSAVFFCLPGVVHNLQKLRQIECQYVQCMENTKNGLPLSLCEEQRDYMTCKYVLGEVFNLIPFAAAFSQILKNVDNALKNPLNFVSTSASAYCSLTCRSVGTGTMCSICSWFEFAGIARDVFCDFGIGPGCDRSVFSSNYWSLDTGICEDIADRYDI